MELRQPDSPSKCTWHIDADPSTNPHTKAPYSKNNDLKVFTNVLEAIGNTPLIKLNRIPLSEGVKCNVLVKCEFMNPGGSVKDRIAVRMIEDAERKGWLKPGGTIIEVSAGNTGIGLAMACAVKGYRCVVVMGDRNSKDKADVLTALGVELIRTPVLMKQQFELCHKIQSQTPNSIIITQFSNESNPLAHYDITASEIYEQCNGNINMLVAGSGTGGTITGVGRRLKEIIPSCLVVGADVTGSFLNKEDGKNPEYTTVEGIGAPFRPLVTDTDVVDFWVKISDAEAYSMARRLQKEEGILCGGSSGVAVAAGLKAAARLTENQTCVIVLPDGLRNYTNTFVSDRWLESRHFKSCVNIHNHWWWDVEIKALNVNRPVTVLENTSCAETIQVMKNNSCKMIAVINSEKSLVGIASISNIMSKLRNRKVELVSSISKAAIMDFRILTVIDKLGLASRILEIESFILIVDEKQVDLNNIKVGNICGTITNTQLLHYISNHDKS